MAVSSGWIAFFIACPFSRCQRQLVVVLVGRRELAQRRRQACECLPLELADPLPREAELHADRLQRLWIAVETEAQLEDSLLTLGEVGQRLAQRAGTQGLLGRRLRIDGLLVCEQVAELGVVVADRRVERGA